MDIVSIMLEKTVYITFCTVQLLNKIHFITLKKQTYFLIDFTEWQKNPKGLLDITRVYAMNSVAYGCNGKYCPVEVRLV